MAGFEDDPALEPRPEDTGPDLSDQSRAKAAGILGALESTARTTKDRLWHDRNCSRASALQDIAAMEAQLQRAKVALSARRSPVVPQ